MFGNIFFFFFRKSCHLWDNVEKYCRAGQATDENMPHANCILDAQGYKYTVRICNTYCLPNKTMVAWTCLIVTLYVHCLSYSFLFLELGRRPHCKSGRAACCSALLDWFGKLNNFLMALYPTFKTAVHYCAHNVLTTARHQSLSWTMQCTQPIQRSCFVCGNINSIWRTTLFRLSTADYSIRL